MRSAVSTEVRKPARGMRRTLRRAAILAALVAALVLAHRPLLAGVARLMTVETPIERADAILPLYQDPRTIPAAAATWLHRGFAKQILLYRPKLRRLEKLGLRPRPQEIMRRLLESQGVPPECIVEIGSDVDSASELVETLAGFLGPNRESRVIVVASAPRSRLTWAPLQNAVAGRLIDLRLDAVAPAEFDERTWWNTREGVITYFDSYVLLLLRFVR